jgi:TolB protein
VTKANRWQDGQQTAFIFARDGSPELYVMNADGTAPRRVTSGFGNIGSPSWSSGGTLSLFSSDRTGQVEPYARNLNDLLVQQFTFDEGNEFNGVWGPAGTP